MSEDWSYPEQDYSPYDRPRWSQVAENFYAWDYGQAQAENTQLYYRVVDEAEAAKAAIKAAEEQRIKEKTVAVEDFDNTVWGQRARERVKKKPWWKPLL